MIIGKNIDLTLVTESDAEFIFEMRTNSSRSKYLSSISSNLKEQKEWLEEYKKRENQKQEFYFLILSKEQEKLGLIRIYDLKKESFCWGSWIIKESSPKTTAIESALQIYEFAFYTLGFDASHFDVRKDNARTNAFHQRFGAKIMEEDELNYYYKFSKDNYELIKQKYERFLS